MQAVQTTQATAPTTPDTWNMREIIQKFGLTQTEVLEAVKAVGPNRIKVEEYLSARQ